MLRDLHAVLRDYPGQAPVLAPLGDIPAFLARPQIRLTSGQAAARRRTQPSSRSASSSGGCI
jgi:hypothetical protein